ncbi:DUF1746-domain-containing protein [Whalleya microplaca]|nr:DUF1746-domain-containing protein [Whalleya microplaca]
MNNDSTPTSPADPHRTSRHLQEDNADDPSDQPQNGSAATQGPSLSKKAKDGLSKKLQFMVHLTVNLDTLVCSFLRLMMRWVAQTLFVSPKPEDTVLIIPNYHVSAIVGPNVLCMLMHLLSSLPQAGEAARGYLHGGILFDFVGQKPPSSRLTLLVLDLMVFALQCLMMTVNMEKERVRKVVKPPRQLIATVDATGVTTTSQDHDAEERGVLRDAPVLDETNDIEMQSLLHNEGGESQRSGEEMTGLPRRTSASTGNGLEGLADTLRSGNAVLANFHVPQALRTAWYNRGNTPESAAAYAIQNVGYNATLAALAAQRRARLAAAQQRQP